MPSLSSQSLESLRSKIDSSNLEPIARSVGFLKRSSKKLTPQNFLLTCCLFALDSAGSFSKFAQFWFQTTRITISKQAIAKRFSSPAIRFLQAVLQQVLFSMAALPSNLPVGAFNRILIQDSTCLKLPSFLAHLFPGSINQSGKSAVLKVQACLDLVKNTFLGFMVTPYTVNDQKASSLALPDLQPGDLIIRDLGYFVLGVFKQIHEKGAFFLSRLRSDVCLFDASGQKIDLLEVLRGRSSWDQEVFLGQEKLPVRLVAQRLTPAIANERRRKEKAKRDKRTKRTSEFYKLLDWSILITNIPRAKLEFPVLFKLYELRWRIEIIFKAWKSHFKMDSLDKECSANQVMIILLGKLIWICWFTVHFTQLCREGYQISILKLAAWWQTFARVVFASSNPVQIEEILAGLVYYCRYEKRQDRKNYLQKLCSALPLG